MTREDAIQILCSYGVPQDEEQFAKAIDSAIEALKKRMPKKAIYVYEGHRYKCPSCYGELAFIDCGADITYCIHCGQAIKWAESRRTEDAGGN